LVLAGGESLLRKDLFSFLEKIYKYNKYYLLSILTNGSLITEENASKLKSLGVGVVQVSLEGLEKNNDAIRGKNAFRKTIRAIEILARFKIKVVVCMTLNKQNIFDVSSLIHLCEELGVFQLGFRRLVPIGEGKQLIKLMLQPEELKDFYLYIENKQRQLIRKTSSLRLVGGCDESILSPEVSRPLINCGVTEGRILTILPNGDVTACRRLPIKIGNVLEKELLDIYYTSNKLKQLMNLNNASRICKECLYFEACLSGAKCVSYAYFNKISVPDPQCLRLFKKLPDPGLFKKEKDKINRKYRFHFTLMPWLFKWAVKIHQGGSRENMKNYF